MKVINPTKETCEICREEKATKALRGDRITLNYCDNCFEAMKKIIFDDGK